MVLPSRSLGFFSAIGAHVPRTGAGAGYSTRRVDVVGIRLPSSPRTRACDPAGLPLEVGETCLVDTDHGPEFGTVAATVIANPFFGPGSRIPKVLRRATRDDEEAF